MRRGLYALIVMLGVAGGCGKNDKPPPPSTGVPNAQPESGPGGRRPMPMGDDGEEGGTEAEKLFFKTCAACHGRDGTGNGPAAENLNPKPRNYTDPKWQASVTDDEIKKTIVLGGAGVGKSAMMPPNPKLKDRPEVVDELVGIIRAFGRKK
jgi:mono/diheme cytochrome c family protein